MIDIFPRLVRREHNLKLKNAAAQRTLMIVEANPVLSDGIRQILEDDAFLSSFEISVLDTVPEFVTGAVLPEILILDPWQHVGPLGTLADVFHPLADQTLLIGYCPYISAADAQMLASLGFRGIMPRTVQSDEFVRIVCAVAFGGTYLHEKYRDYPTKSDSQGNPEDAGLPDLTEREAEVLRLVALGNSIKEIAAALKISTKTVDTYKTRAGRKLDLRTRADIVRFAIKCGWLN